MIIYDSDLSDIPIITSMDNDNDNNNIIYIYNDNDLTHIPIITSIGNDNDNINILYDNDISNIPIITSMDIDNDNDNNDINDNLMILVRLSSIANGNEPILTIDGTPILTIPVPICGVIISVIP